MGSFLDDNITTQIKEVFTNLVNPVHILVFTSKENCEYCEDTRLLLEEVCGLSDKLHYQPVDIDTDAKLAKEYLIDRTPAVAVLGMVDDKQTDHGIRFSGIPAGHEFSALIHSIISVSRQETGISSQTQAFLDSLKSPVHLEIFTTPTWPYCPQAVVLAHRFALASQMVTSDAIEATEFPELADKYRVSGVPHTVINLGAGNLIGAAPEEMLVAEIQKTLK